MALILFGISNCDTVRKARKALSADETSYVFHDFRKDGLSLDQVSAMLTALGAEKLLNRRGTTWRHLSDADKARADGEGLASLLVEYPALIKRPIWKGGDEFKIGFSAADADTLLLWAKGLRAA